MKPIGPVLLIALSCACSSVPDRAPVPRIVVAEGRIITMTEHDEDGGRTPLSSDVTFVDANSRLEILIDLAALRASIPEEFVAKDIQDDLDRLLEIQRDAVAGLAGLERLATAADAYALDERNYAPLEQALQTVAQPGDRLLTLLQDPNNKLNSLEPEFQRRLLANDAGEGGYRALFELAEQHARAEIELTDEQLAKQGLAVLFEGRLLQENGTSNVHLPGFDTYPEGEYFRVERWRVAPTPEDASKLEELKALAQQVNSGQVSARDLVRQLARDLLGGVERDARRCLDDAKKGLSEILAKGGTTFDAEKAEFESLVSRASDLLAHLGDLKNRYLQGDSFDVRSFLSDMRNLSERFKTLGADVKAFLARVKAKVDGLGNDVIGLRDQVVACAEKLLGSLKNRALKITDLVGVTSAAQRTADRLGAYGDKVLALSIDALPESTELDLRTTGARKVGDALLFRIGCTRVDPEDGTRAGEVRTLEQRRFELAQTLAHTETAVTLGFLDPNGTAGLQREWQAVPAFSILLKRDSREHGFYNRILDPGIGLMVAAPDFDGDDAPELGVGLVVSLFRDYLQAGYGYDVSDDRWFGFFGVGIPLSSMASGVK